MPKLNFATYIAQQLARAAHFTDKDDLCADDILGALCAYVRKHAPSGSGFDTGTTLVIERCNASRLVFGTEFHHMNECGYYSGWSKHTVTCRATFSGSPTWSISGRDRDGIKDHIADTFHHWLLSAEVDHPPLVEDSSYA